MPPSSPPPTASPELPPSPPVSTSPDTSFCADDPKAAANSPSPPTPLSRNLEKLAITLRQPDTSCFLSPAQWQQIAPRLADVRCEYDPSAQKASHHMTTPLHDKVVLAVKNSLCAQIERLKEDESLSPDLRQTVEQLTDGGHEAVELETKEGHPWRADPDVQLKQQAEDTLPTFVAEIAVSETDEHVIKKCKNYIRYSHGCIRAALVVTAPYGNRKYGSYHLFRPAKRSFAPGNCHGKAAIEEVDSAVYRTTEMEVGGQIKLRLSDFVSFAPNTALRQEADGMVLPIDLSELHRAVELGRRIEANRSAEKNGSASRKRPASEFEDDSFSDESDYSPTDGEQGDELVHERPKMRTRKQGRIDPDL